MDSVMGFYEVETPEDCSVAVIYVTHYDKHKFVPIQLLSNSSQNYELEVVLPSFHTFHTWKTMDITSKKMNDTDALTLECTLKWDLARLVYNAEWQKFCAWINREWFAKHWRKYGRYSKLVVKLVDSVDGC